MKRSSPVLVLTGVLVAATMGISYAITNGEPDGNRHPYVGLIVFDNAPGRPAWRCSGALLCGAVILTTE